MKRILLVALIGLFLLSSCSFGKKDIEAYDYWAREAVKGKNTLVYMLLHNHSKTTDELTGISSDAATTIELSKGSISDVGVVEMIPQTFIPLAVNTEIRFEPGDFRITLVGLKNDLHIGDEITVTLHFKTHEDITLTVPVADSSSMSSSHDMEGMDMDTPAP